MRTWPLLLTAQSGFVAVSLGALGAHALEARLAANAAFDALDAWRTAAHYHLAHTIACLALIAWAAAQPARSLRLQRIVALWLTGCLLFSGSIYLLALDGPRFLGPVTPLGGLAFLAGWALLALEARKSNAS